MWAEALLKGKNIPMKGVNMGNHVLGADWGIKYYFEYIPSIFGVMVTWSESSEAA